jgi:type IX secretion system PorP/SprF family membrane protein
LGSDASRFLFDVSAGVFYQVLDQYEIGVSLNHINKSTFDKTMPNGIYNQIRTLHLSANYHFTLEQFPMIDFVPSTLIKSDFSSMQVDLSLLGVYQNTYWGGLSYRWGDAVVLLGGIFITPLNMQVGLAYDLAASGMIHTSKIGGSFEVFARYNFNLSVDRLPRSYKNSRYL